ncbi:MAG: cob(I)yrinic acid a,c-diamide adenosyltransferase [Planctomycetota bacterium]|nr:cob(I)yrinic acid a,c-diamide adenosyltransferase [Planctomycetota bacterium]
MALPTKTGDSGFTSLPGEKSPVRKDDARLSALGELDELSAAVGLCLVEAGRTGRDAVCEALSDVQSELILLGAALATGWHGQVEDLAVMSVPSADTAKQSLTVPPASLDEAVARMEKRIDAIRDELPELKDFILPGGCELACRLHLARTIARRAERAVVTALNPTDYKQSPAAAELRYLNRLSSLLFALARLANRGSQIATHSDSGSTHNASEAEITPSP